MVLFDFAALFLCYLVFSFDLSQVDARKKKRQKKKIPTTIITDSDDQNLYEVTLPSGQALTFHDPKAAPKLTKWATDLAKTEGSATFGQAVAREQYVIQKVNSGAWSSDAYHDYQRLAATTGNVDSARLLLQYGIAPLISEVITNPLKSPLHHAAATCKIAQIRSLLQLDMDDDDDDVDVVFVDEPLEDGSTPLAAAALAGCVEAIQLLAEAGADLESTGTHGATPLMIAAAAGEATVVSELLKLGADGNAQHKFAGNTPLHMAAENDWPEAVAALCRGGATCGVFSRSSNGTALHTAVDVNVTVATIRALLDHQTCGCDIESKLNGDTTPLYLAADHGHSQQLEALIQFGASIDYSMPIADWSGGNQLARRQSLGGSEEDEYAEIFEMNSEPANGASPLHAAVERGHAACVSLLLAAGADVNTQSMGGVSPLHSAAMHGLGDTDKIIDELIAAGAEVNARTNNREGATALYHSVSNGFELVSQKLIQHGADVNQGQKKSGGTPLIAAVARGQVKNIQLLLKHGADVDRKSELKSGGSTALEVAVSIGHFQIVQMLLSADATVCASDSSLLFVAVSNQQAQIAKLLLDHILQERHMNEERKKNCEDSSLLLWQSLDSGATALHVAAQIHHFDSIELILKTAHEFDADMKNDQNRPTLVGQLLEMRTLPIAGGSVTALYLAVKSAAETTSSAKLNEAMECLSLLLSWGADVNSALTAQEGGFTPLLAAIEADHHDMVALLLQHGADANLGTMHASVSFRAPILYAVLFGYAPIVKLLLDAGANCQIVAGTRNAPKTLLDLARERRHYDTLQLLLSVEECNLDLSKVEL